DVSVEKAYLNELKLVFPSSGGDNSISPLDYATPKSFDNTYYKLILGGRGLLFTDQQLYTGNHLNFLNWSSLLLKMRSYSLITLLSLWLRWEPLALS
ncbi:Peroxidase 70, partial [Bienertia sinuspersici]